MKKFLFTLAALLMTSTAFAESYLYIDAEDVVVTADDIANGTELEIPVRASFAARVSGWDFEITNLPAGITFTFAEKGADFDVTTMNARGRYQVVSATLYGAEEPFLHMLAVQGEVGYWQDPNGENPNAWVSYGVAKWEGGDYAEMLLMYAVFDENYHGGVIETLTSVASGNDARGGTVQEQGDHAKYFTHDGGMMEDPNPITEEPADAPVINFAEDADGVMITIENYTECSIKVDGVEVATEAPYYVEKIYDAAQAIVVYAKNAPEGFTPAEDTKTYDLPEKQKEQTEAPVIIVTPGDTEYTFGAYGEGTVTLYINGVEVENPYSVARTDVDQVVAVRAVAHVDNQLDGVFNGEYVIPALETPQPYQTPDPVISTELTDEALVITVTGEGTVTLFVQYIDNETGAITTEQYTGEGTVVVPVARGDEDTYINYYATAQANDEAIPAVTGVTYSVEVPKVEGEQPPVIDPEHQEGWWIMLLDKNGGEVWYRLWRGSDGSYTTTVTLDYEKYGEFYLDPNDPTTEENRPAVPFYFVVDGTIWGSAQELQTTAMGESANTVSNPLFANEEGFYTVPVGFSYTLGIYVDLTGLRPDTDKYVYCAQALPTGVDELNGEKAVAGVRYFNMAGQEMQQANGMTIVVTTYTDGTTSAVKVMK